MLKLLLVRIHCICLRVHQVHVTLISKVRYWLWILSLEGLTLVYSWVVAILKCRLLVLLSVLLAEGNVLLILEVANFDTGSRAHVLVVEFDPFMILCHVLLLHPLLDILVLHHDPVLFLRWYLLLFEAGADARVVVVVVLGLALVIASLVVIGVVVGLILESHGIYRIGHSVQLAWPLSLPSMRMILHLMLELVAVHLVLDELLVRLKLLDAIDELWLLAWVKPKILLVLSHLLLQRHTGRLLIAVKSIHVRLLRWAEVVLRVELVGLGLLVLKVERSHVRINVVQLILILLVKRVIVLGEVVLALALWLLIKVVR